MSPVTLDLEAAQLPSDAVEVGRIGEAWGVKGWVKVLAFSAQPEALFSSKRWYLLPSERGGKAFEGTRLLRIREAKEHSGLVVANAHQIDDRSSAEALKGARVFVARSSFPTAAPDEFYCVDLIGLNVVNREGVALGTVREMLSSAAQTVLVIEREEASKVQQHLIPFVAAFVESVDVAAKLIVVDWQTDYSV